MRRFHTTTVSSTATTAPPMPVTLVEWKALNRNTLLGFATIQLGKSLVVSDCPVHRTATGDGGFRYWAALPAKPVVDRDGRAVRDGTGRIKYAALLSWADRDAADQFSAAVVEACRVHLDPADRAA